MYFQHFSDAAAEAELDTTLRSLFARAGTPIPGPANVDGPLLDALQQLKAEERIDEGALGKTRALAAAIAALKARIALREGLSSSTVAPTIVGVANTPSGAPAIVTQKRSMGPWLAVGGGLVAVALLLKR